MKPLALLRPYVLRHRRVALFALVGLLLSSAAMLALFYGIREMIDRGFSPGNKGAITSIFWPCSGSARCCAAGSALRFYCVAWLGERVVAELGPTFSAI